MRDIPVRFERAARRRFECRDAQQQRETVQKAAKAGNAVNAETDPLRRVAAFRRGGAEIVHGQTTDFLDVAFLETARLRANAVCRIITRNGQGLGTGWLISESLLITNNHVIPSAADSRDLLAEFDYERSPAGVPRPVSRFEFDPGTFFETDDEDDLDYTVLAVGRRLSGGRTLAALGFIPLRASPDRHAVGEYVNLIQHPNGDFKQVALHENRIVSRLDTVLHYITDTLPGSSGSPVLNLRCQAVALHHWGGPHRQVRHPDGRLVDQNANEGIRISAIVIELRERLNGMSAGKANLLRAALNSSETAVIEESPAAATEDGVIRRIIPVEICVRIPRIGDASPPADHLATKGDNTVTPPDSERIEIDPNYANRRGYNPAFLKGHLIPLPELSAAQKKLAAPNSKPTAGKPAYVLDYVHFSIAMHKKRRTAFYCATNIDGKTWKNINRKTGAISSEAAEAREPWFIDPRLNEDHQANDDDYKPFTNQFQRGHLVRRQYPSWGNDATALRADADTFHFPNCALQHKFFNPKTTQWLGLEDYVLGNAKENDVRVTVFSGPVLHRNDPRFGRIQAPLIFWKVVARLEGNNLIAMALKASQRKFVKKVEALGEAFDELPDALEGFQTTVRDIEKLTGLDFGTLRDLDVLADVGESLGEGIPLNSVDDYVTVRLPAPRLLRKRK